MIWVDLGGGTGVSSEARHIVFETADGSIVHGSFVEMKHLRSTRYFEHTTFTLLKRTQENVDMMSEYMPLENFKAIYVVDLCSSLVTVAKNKAKEKGWKNVHVVEGDACAFSPPEGTATLVTFSYSLSSACSTQLDICQILPKQFAL